MMAYDEINYNYIVGQCHCTDTVSRIHTEIAEACSYADTRHTYFNKFSNSKRNPPINKSRNAQFTNPPKSLKPDDHENSESWYL